GPAIAWRRCRSSRRLPLCYSPRGRLTEVTPLVRVSSNSGTAVAPTGGFGFLSDAYRFGNGSSLDALRCVASTRNRDKIGGRRLLYRFTCITDTDLVLDIPEEEV